MHVTSRRSGWRFQIRVPRDLESILGRSPIRLNLGPVAKRDAARTARLLAGHAESVFLACRKGARMTKDELIEELQEMLVGAMDMAQSIAEAAERRRAADVTTVTLNLMTEHHREQRDMDRRIQTLGGGINSLQETIARLPKPHRDALAAQIDELSTLVKQSLDGGAVRPLVLDELGGWLLLRQGHASEKKVRTDGNRIRDFVAVAGNRPVNKYRYSDFQAFANLLARLPANYVKEPRLRNMTREEAADYNDSLPPDRRYETLAGKAIDTNYFSPLRMFFRAMAAEHDFRSPLADITVTIPPARKNR